ncbi:MAG: hypothetical protein IT293_12005 [Deltaproteobacteria bacterium]|nr:hypothetical protein [Deltaproteobacteria bacterium]
MTRKRKAAAALPHPDVDAALAAMGAEELREVARTMLLELDDRAYGRVTTALVARAARGGSGWVPAAPSAAAVAEVAAFAAAAKCAGYADPSDVDERLRRGTAAFLRTDYAAARWMFGALLPPIAAAEIDLGQHELIDEVLAVDASECAVQYVVAVYITSDPARRGEAVRAAIDEVRGIGNFFEPIRAMEDAALAPLPDLDAFLGQWCAIVAQEAAGERRGGWDAEADRWLREVVERMEGSDGLGRIARETKRAEDLRAWCRSVVEAGDWQRALSAFTEAAEVVSAKAGARGEFLDGAALAAQQLAAEDLSPWLERAWREAPSFARLRRWLGAARDAATLRERAVAALGACPQWAHRQRAVLHVLQGDLEAAAKLLVAAPGLGWSGDEHPGRVLFPLFQKLLGTNGTSSPDLTLPDGALEVEERAIFDVERDEPHLATPDLAAVFRHAGVEPVAAAKLRKVVLAAMRQAAEKRIAGVTEEKRRRHYGHAASLVAACVAADRSQESARWAATIRAEYRRFPALRAELDRGVSVR